MNRKINMLVMILIIMMLTACASAPKIALQHEVKQAIKSIAVVETPEPCRYYVDPGPSPAGAALYMFGAIGGAIVGGIEASRHESATRKFTETIAPLEPNLTNTMLVALEKGLTEKGYSIKRIPPPPKNADGKGYDISKIEESFDTILVAAINGGYCVDSGKATPKICVSISLYSGSGTDMIFADTYLYCSKKIGQSVHISPDPKYIFDSIDALYEDIALSVEGLKTGAEKVAERAVSDL